MTGTLTLPLVVAPGEVKAPKEDVKPKTRRKETKKVATEEQVLDAEFTPDEPKPNGSQSLQVRTPADYVWLAIERDLPIEKLQALMAMEREWRADKAKAEYTQAMVQFGKLKQVVAHNRTGKTAGNAPFSYSDFPQLVAAVTPWLSQCDLNFDHSQDDPVMVDGKVSYIQVHCRVEHAGGHSITRSFPAIPDPKLAGHVSPSQLMQLAITYAKRQTLSMALGIATAEDKSDDDATTHEGELITNNQVADLSTLMTEVKADRDKFLKLFKVGTLAEIQVRDYKRAVKMLEDKRRGVGDFKKVTQ